DAGAHGLDDVVLGGADLLAEDLDVEFSVEARPVADAPFGVLVAVDARPELPEQLDHRVDVGEARDPAQGALALGHQAGGKDRQRRVLAAADFDFAFESGSAPDSKAVHRARPWAPDLASAGASPGSPEKSRHARVSRNFRSIGQSV